MSALHSSRDALLRYGLGLIAILLVGALLGSLLGLDVIALVGQVLDVTPVVLAIVFLYLFYRFVLAVERIAAQR